jgi:hypothetical protein
MVYMLAEIWFCFSLFCICNYIVVRIPWSLHVTDVPSIIWLGYIGTISYKFISEVLSFYVKLSQFLKFVIMCVISAVNL